MLLSRRRAKGLYALPDAHSPLLSVRSSRNRTARRNKEISDTRVLLKRDQRAEILLPRDRSRNFTLTFSRYTDESDLSKVSLKDMLLD